MMCQNHYNPVSTHAVLAKDPQPIIMKVGKRLGEERLLQSAVRYGF